MRVRLFLGWNLKIILSYLKSALLNLTKFNAKFREKIKTPKFQTKNGLFEHFWARIFKNYCLI